MSDPKVNGSNSDQISNANVDDLLSDIEQMADHVEDLIGKEEKKKSPPAAEVPSDSANLPSAGESGTAAPADPLGMDQAEDLAQMDQLACQAAEEVGKEIQNPGEDLSDSSTAEAENPAVPLDPEPQKEIQVDEHIDQLAEDEINEAIGRLDQKEKGEAVDASASPVERSLQIDDLPAPFRVFLKVLMILNRPFIWLPRPIKDVLGYVGLATFLLGVMLWIFVFVLGKK